MSFLANNKRSRRLPASRDAVASGKLVRRYCKIVFACGILLEFVKGITKLEHGVGYLFTIRIVIEYVFELDDTLVEITGHIMGFTQPVLRVTGIDTFRIPAQKRYEFGFRIFVAAFLELLKCRLVGRFFFTLCCRWGLRNRRSRGLCRCARRLGCRKVPPTGFPCRLRWKLQVVQPPGC